MDLPDSISGLIKAQNSFDSLAYISHFSDDAIVYDEGGRHKGKEEIRRWNEMTNAKYQTQLEPLEITESDNKIVLKTMVSGTFEGSPIQLEYHFETRDSEIISLRITG